MGNKFLRLFLIVISSFAASVGLASCSVMNDGNTNTTSDSTSIHNPTTDTTSDSSTVPHSDNYNQHNLSFAVISEEEKTCEVIGYKKFYNDERDNYISIPKMWNDYKVTSIGDFAFELCSSLRSIVIPDSVTSIGNSAFSNCKSLSSIVIPDSVTSIGNYAFWYCTSLRSIVIPDSVTSIGNYAFYYCRSLRSVTIGNSVTSIGDGAFYECTSLSDVYYIGSEEQWNAISIGSRNDRLKSATIHYNYIGK